MGHTYRVLFCDFDGPFDFSDTLSSIGYVVDQIRPDALRQISVGDHDLYLFSFDTDEHQKKAIKTCEKLKQADLKIPIILMNREVVSPEFLNHQGSRYAADGYVARPQSPAVLLDAIERLIGVPVPLSLKGNVQIVSDDREELETARIKILELQKEIESIQSEHHKNGESLEKALEAQRNYYRPKLKALLEEHSVQLQTETERLKVRLSEIEAKLLERESRLKEVEGNHEKALSKLREFYQNKLRALETGKKSTS